VSTFQMTRIISSEGLPPIAGGQASDITYRTYATYVPYYVMLDVLL
jgi:hypothetical protein